MSTLGLFSSVTELLIVFLTTIIFAYYLYYKKCYTYWKKRGVPTADPVFPVGDLSVSAFGIQSVYFRLQDLYTSFRAKGIKHAGLYFYNGPIYFPVDVELVKRILVTDFDHFVDRGMYINEEKMPITAHMFSMKGDQWKNVRNKFSPVFTSGKMKTMYNIVNSNVENLVNILKDLDGTEVDIKEKLVRLTTDIIGSVAFGIDCNSLKNPHQEFVEMVDKIFSNSRWELIKLAFEEGLQNPGNIIKIAHSNKKVVNFFTNLVHETVEYRDKNKVQRDDLLNILLKLRDTVGMSMNEIVAQSYLFFTAGFETSSSSMSFCLHELAHNQELQDRAREEILENLGNDVTKYTYDEVLSLPVLDRLLKETLRKYPPVGMLNRIVVKDYKVPGTESVIETGTPVVISVLGIQRDPEYFSDPLKFDPDRFKNEKKFVPFSFMPFGEGPRNCIGMRFGLMQTKLGLAALLSNFKFLPSKKSPAEVAIDPSTTTIVMNVKGGIYANIVKVD